MEIQAAMQIRHGCDEIHNTLLKKKEAFRFNINSVSYQDDLTEFQTTRVAGKVTQTSGMSEITNMWRLPQAVARQPKLSRSFCRNEIQHADK